MQSYSEEDTYNFASKMALKALPGDLYCLSGDLGAGKSVFARGFIHAAADSKIDVPSPTFTLLQTYDTKRGPLAHFDLYRLKTADEIFELGWEEIISDHIVLTEWPERLGPYLPKKHIDIIFSNIDNNTRNIEVIRHA